MLGINMNFHVKDWWAQNTGKSKENVCIPIFIFLDHQSIISIAVYLST